MILVLARGYDCPKDRWQHRRPVDFYSELKVGYTRIVTISTDKLLETAEFRDGLTPSGRSCRIPVAEYRRTWTSPSTPTPATIR